MLVVILASFLEEKGFRLGFKVCVELKIAVISSFRCLSGKGVPEFGFVGSFSLLHDPLYLAS